MRTALPALLIALFITGCASSAGSVDPNDSSQPDTVSGAPGRQSGETARIPPRYEDLSPAGRALLEQSRQQQLAGDTRTAAATLERAIRIEPDEPLYWLELGRIRMRQGNFAQAEQMGRKALSLAEPESLYAQLSTQLIADALRAVGRYKDAQKLTQP